MHTVEEAMTVEVITVGPDEPVTVAARIMRDAGVSGLPVVDASGAVLGILTEADLLHRAVLADLAEVGDRGGSRDRSSGSTVADLMSCDVLAVRRDAPLAKAARLMEKARVRRLLVVGPEFVIKGIISRRDVVAALARSDGDIEAEIRSCVIDEILGLDPRQVEVSVDQGSIPGWRDVMDNFKRILVTASPGHLAPAALRAAVRLADTSNAHLTVLSVLDPLPRWRRTVKAEGRVIDVQDLVLRDRSERFRRFCRIHPSPARGLSRDENWQTVGRGYSVCPQP